MVMRFKFDFTLKDCLSGGDKSAKKADLDKYLYSGYGVGFTLCSLLAFIVKF